MTSVVTSAQGLSAPSCFGNFVIGKDKFWDLEGPVVAVGEALGGRCCPGPGGDQGSSSQGNGEVRRSAGSHPPSFLRSQRLNSRARAARPAMLTSTPVTPAAAEPLLLLGSPEGGAVLSWRAWPWSRPPCARELPSGLGQRLSLGDKVPEASQVRYGKDLAPLCQGRGQGPGAAEARSMQRVRRPPPRPGSRASGVTPGPPACVPGPECHPPGLRESPQSFLGHSLFTWWPGHRNSPVT